MPDVFTAPQNQITEKDKIVLPINQNTSVSGFHHSKKADGYLNSLEQKDVHKIDGHSHNLLSGYCLHPDHINFSSADPDEKVILLLRKHPITNLSWIIIAFFMLVIPSVFTFLPFFDKLPSGFQLVLSLIWYLTTMAYCLENFLEWFFNVNLITNERVIDVDFINLLYREVSEAELEKIQEPTFDMGGVVESFFNFGDVSIQTAAEISKIEFKSVPKPDKVVQILRDLGIKEQVERMKKRYS